MKSRLSPRQYLSPDVLEREKERLFGRLWIFAGLKTLLSRPDSYFARMLAGVPVVIQNFDGELRAFENLCSHRQNPLQPLGYGNRPLVCGYHGWRYDCRGSVSVIPLHDDYYRYRSGEVKGLRRFALRAVGNLVFVNLAAQPLPFEEQFGAGLVAALESVSSAFDDEVLVAQWRARHNWKLAYENLRDGLHPRFVHTRSLAMEVDFDPPPPPPMQSESADPSLADLSWGGAEGRFRKQRPQGFHQHVQRWGSEDAYFNWLLYPNTHVLSSDGGYSFSIEHHDPVSPGETEVTAYYMTARRKRPWQGSAAALWAYARGAKVILDEDTQVMEAIQQSLHAAAPAATQGAFEHDNRRVEAWYCKALGDNL